jgi:hypothetical protein
MAGTDARSISAVLLILSLAPSPRASNKGMPARFAERIAARYGAADFDRVESIKYTFNVLHGGKAKAREWTWFPKPDSVVFRGPDEKGAILSASYSRKNKWSMGAPQIAGIDKSFVNDQYWLLFPLHLAWDKGIALAMKEPMTLEVRYPKEGGYTPGDAYELMADSTGTISKWMFRKGGADTVTMQADWSRPVIVDGLPFSLERPGKNGFKVWFTGVKVTRAP